MRVYIVQAVTEREGSPPSAYIVRERAMPEARHSIVTALPAVGIFRVVEEGSAPVALGKAERLRDDLTAKAEKEAGVAA